MKIEKRIHPIWKRREKLGHANLVPIGRYQYIYTHKGNSISLVSFPDYLSDGRTFWEIYCLEGNLFEDVEIFDTKAEAEKRIRKLLRCESD